MWWEMTDKVEWEYYFDEDCQAGTCQHARYYAMGDEKPISCPVRKRRKLLSPGRESNAAN